MTADPLRAVAHRPWPLPAGPWVMAQTWHDLLFAHRPIPAEELRAHIPESLEVDTFAGSAWLGVVPFRMSGVRLRGLPPFPGTGAFPELNLRTYVRLADRPGVWFFSLDAASRIAVAVARAWFRLPYFRARMRCDASGEAIDYASERTHTGAPPASLRASYAPDGAVFHARPGTLEHWLTERYCLYAARGTGQVWRGEIHHAPWPLQPARAELAECTLSQAQGIAVPDAPPHLMFARRIDVRVWPPAGV